MSRSAGGRRRRARVSRSQGGARPLLPCSGLPESRAWSCQPPRLRRQVQRWESSGAQHPRLHLPPGGFGALERSAPIADGTCWSRLAHELSLSACLP
ncbi:unnamed protein product [Coccothraustes coccothraustes]